MAGWLPGTAIPTSGVFSVPLLFHGTRSREFSRSCPLSFHPPQGRSLGLLGSKEPVPQFSALWSLGPFLQGLNSCCLQRPRHRGAQSDRRRLGTQGQSGQERGALRPGPQRRSLWTAPGRAWSGDSGPNSLSQVEEQARSGAKTGPQEAALPSALCLGRSSEMSSPSPDARGTRT